MYFYELKISPHAKWGPISIYEEDSVMKMIVSAPNDMVARSLALHREIVYKEGRNRATLHFWGPTIEDQIKSIDCLLIGKSYVKEQIIATSEQHATG